MADVATLERELNELNARIQACNTKRSALEKSLTIHETREAEARKNLKIFGIDDENISIEALEALKQERLAFIEKSIKEATALVQAAEEALESKEGTV